MPLTTAQNQQEFLWHLMGAGSEASWTIIKDWADDGNDLSQIVGHQAMYLWPATLQHNGTLVGAEATDTGMPRITLADAATQRVKGIFPLQPGWDRVAIRWGTVNEGAGTGLVRWQLAYKFIDLNETNVNGAVTTITPADQASGAINAWTYVAPTETSLITVPDGVIGGKPLMMVSLSRLGAADAHSGAVSVATVTATLIS